MKYYYLLLNKENSYNNNSSLLALEKQAVHAENNALNFYENLSAVLTYTFGKTEDEDVQAEKKFQNAAVMADAAKNDAASIIASLKNNIPSLPLFLRFKNKDYYAMIKSLPSYYKDLNTASSFQEQCLKYSAPLTKKLMRLFSKIIWKFVPLEDLSVLSHLLRLRN